MQSEIERAFAEATQLFCVPTPPSAAEQERRVRVRTDDNCAIKKEQHGTAFSGVANVDLAELVARLREPGSFEYAEYAVAVAAFAQRNIDFYTETAPTTTERIRKRRAQLLADARRTKRDLADGLRITTMRENLATALDRLQTGMIGMRAVKSNVAASVLNFLYYPQRVRRTHMNVALLAPPGTGKTTLARRLADVYGALGVLPDRKAPFASIGAASLESPRALRAFLTNALGGVALIDEAYALGEHADSAMLTELVSLLDQFKGEVLVVLAGYRNRIERGIFNENAGASSRFTQQWVVQPMDADTIDRIFFRAATRQRFLFSDDAAKMVRALIDEAVRRNMFARSNARGALALFDEVRRAHVPSQFVQSGEARERSKFRPSDTIGVDAVRAGFAQYMLNNERVRIVWTAQE